MIDISLEDGIDLIRKSVTPKKSYDVVDIDKALGRILFEDIFAKYDNPPFDRSPIDGYACKSSDLQNCDKENPNVLKVVGELNAGCSETFKVQDGECVRIMTGAKIPEECDCCVMQEDTNYSDDFVEIYKTTKKHMNYCFKGEDYEKGALLLKKGCKISYIEVGILASSGINQVKVLSMPKILLMATGDELLMPSEEILPAKIYNSNMFMIEARLRELEFTDIEKVHLKDDDKTICEYIEKCYGRFHLVITTGGVSVGKKDIFHDVVKADDFNQIFWKLKIQPGTPIMFSMYRDMPIVSLSGNPFASLVNFELVVRELLFLYNQDEKLKTMKTKGILQNPFNKKSKQRRFIRCTYIDGRVFINEDGHSSGVLSSLIGCNALIEVKALSDCLNVGDTVDVIVL